MGKRVRKQFSHQLSAEQLHQRLAQLAEEERASATEGDVIHFERAGEHYQLRGSYSGFQINGAIKIGAEQLTIEIELPLLARMFQGKVETYIQKQAQRLLG